MDIHPASAYIHRATLAAEGMDAVVIAVKRLRPTADPLPLPRHMTAGAAGMDLLADASDPVELPPGTRTLIPTRLAVEIAAGDEAGLMGTSNVDS